MREYALLGPWVRRFLLEYLVGERNLARNTQHSYRDTLRILLPYIVEDVRKPIDTLDVEDVSPDRIRAFLEHLEAERGSSIATRNQRLAAIHSLAQFIAINSPENIAWSGAIRAIPFKRSPRPLVTYLDKKEMDALLDSPDMETVQGRRDHALLLFLYNTGARADEAAQLRIDQLTIGATPERDPSSVLIRGKGGKRRQCPLWPGTVDELTTLIGNRSSSERLFLNRCGRAITRHGVHAMVRRHAIRSADVAPTLSAKRVSPHTIRHTTAMHLLRAGVDINTIRAWLGHVSLKTTNVYAEADLEMKARALATCEIGDTDAKPPWRENPGLMAFLATL